MRRLAAQGSARMAELSPRVALLTEVATAVMDLRDVVGQRNVLITSWIGGAPVQQVVYDDALRLTGRAEQALAGARRLLAGFPGKSQLAAALERQEKGFVEGSERRWQEMLAFARGVLGGAGRAMASDDRGVPFLVRWSTGRDPGPARYRPE